MDKPTFRPLPVEERNRLHEALRQNASDGAALRLNPADTSWSPAELARDLEAETTINAIRSIPCHYADSHTLTRTGLPPLKFDGDLVAVASSHEHNGPLQNRWHEIELYKTAGGKWVWQVAFRTCWQGEHDHERAEVVSAEAEVISDLTVEYDPLAHYQGYPAGAHYAEKDARQREAIRLGYQRAVSELLGKAGLAEVVE